MERPWLTVGRSLTPLGGSRTLAEASLTSIVENFNVRGSYLGELREQLPRAVWTVESEESASTPRTAENVVMTNPARSAGESTYQSPNGTSSFWLEGSDGARYHLDSVATIGRADGNDVQLRSASVSRYHAMLRSIGGHWILVDLDSRNGTRVHGERIAAPRILNPNDPVQFGDTTFRFRTNLNRRAPQATGIYLAVQAHSTEHFRLLYQPETFAGQQLEVVGGRLERFRGALIEVFGFGDAAEPITVYLLDQVSDPEQPDQLLDSGGYARPERRLIYSAYRPESPGVTLERDLLDVVGFAIPAFSRWPQSLRDGFQLFLTRRAESRQEDDEQWAPLVSAFEQGNVPSLTKLVSHAEPAEVQVDTLAFAHLLEHLAAAYGPAAIGVFLSQISETTLDGASRAAFRRSISAIEKRWRSRLKSANLAGIRLFLNLMLPYLRPYRVKISEILVYVSLSVAFGIILAKAEGYLVDKALLAHSFHAFYLIMGGLLIAFVITSLASLREGYVKAWVSAHLLSRMRLSMFQKVQSLEPGYFDRTDSGDLLTRLTSDVFMVESALSTGMVETVRFSLMFVVALVVIFFTQWKLAFVTVVGIPLFLLIGRLLGRPVTRASMELQTETSSVTSSIHQNLSAQPVVKLFGLERRESDSFSAKLDRLIRSSLRLHFLSGLYGFGSDAITNLIQMGVLAFGGYLVLRGHTSTGTLFAFMVLVGQIVTPMQMLSQFFQMVQTGSGSMKRITELLNTRPAIQDGEHAQPLGRLSRGIELEHVVFSYDGTRRILEDVSLRIPVGAKVAIVGPSGSGKSTILHLLTRFYDPDYGRVTLDGVDLRDATIASLRGQIGMVFQESFLFNESIRENIRMARPAATDDEVEAAARAAELHAFITQLPEGYDTLVGERGGHLSGGQRQRVAIARAILRNPALLLLDEATSALDPTTEAAITSTLDRVAEGRTTVSVTHRLASVVRADLIVVLESGRLVEQGTHDELLDAGGLYAQMWSEQQGRVAGAPIAAPSIDLATLQRVPLFAQLDTGLLSNIAMNLDVERFDTGEPIVEVGEPGERLYVIKSGEVEVLAANWEGKPRRLALLGEGDYIGEIALLRDVPRTATVRARTPAELYSLSRDSFQAMLTSLPALRELVMQTVAQREAGLRAVVSQGEPTPVAAVGDV